MPGADFSFDFDRFMAGKPLAITESGLIELKAHVLARISAFQSAPREYIQGLVELLAESDSKAVRETRSRVENATGVIPIRGTISQHAAGDISSAAAGGTATEHVTQVLREFLADESITKIVLDFDSPGGTAYGVQELGNEIFAARATKPIIAVANSRMASAAYWLGSQASRLYASDGAILGSIGVYAIHQDISKLAENEGVKTTLISAGKYKVAGNEFEPLDDEFRQRVQARVNETYASFVNSVARGRGVSPAAVRDGFGEGDVVNAKQAVREGMADGVMTLDQVIVAKFRMRRAGEGSNGDEAASAFLVEEDQEARRAFRTYQFRELREDMAQLSAAVEG